MIKLRTKNKLIFGVGKNDADYFISECPYYRRWHSVLRRCYSKYCHSKNPHYADCTASSDWLVFSVFKEWMTKQDWIGNHLDKDILVPGNKHYSPETCVFVPPAINMLLTNHYSARGKYPQGVSFHRGYGKYQSELSIDGKSVYLGCFETAEEAENTYKTAKAVEITRQANNQADERVRNALIIFAKQLADPEDLGAIASKAF